MYNFWIYNNAATLLFRIVHRNVDVARKNTLDLSQCFQWRICSRNGSTPVPYAVVSVQTNMSDSSIFRPTFEIRYDKIRAYACMVFDTCKIMQNIADKAQISGEKVSAPYFFENGSSIYDRDNFYRWRIFDENEIRTYKPTETEVS